MSTRYPAQLPVAIKLAGFATAEPILARTQNLSENGILLHCNSSFPEGSSVELTIDASPEPFLVTLHGEVLRVTPRSGAEFAIAIRCDFPFHLGRSLT
jgi:hypothetical protein